MNNGHLEPIYARISVYEENAKQMRRATAQMKKYMRQSASERTQMQQEVERMIADLEIRHAEV